MASAKVLLLGDIGVGKSSLARRFIFDHFDANYKTTIGVDIMTHDLDLEDGEAPFRFVLWDTDGDFGQQIFSSVYVVGAAAALIVSDATRPDSLTKAGGLAETFASRFPGRPAKVIVNKIDLLDDPAPRFTVDGLSADDLALTSAKTGQNVMQLFRTLGRTIRRRA
ncbi:GTP-binding protein [Methylovirgula sp. 4M-Z18]|nr:GTP-binding protein [Methylovirgula sp. 4M-Z18]